LSIYRLKGRWQGRGIPVVGEWVARPTISATLGVLLLPAIWRPPFYKSDGD
jgi:hypothetical protein